MKFIKTMKHLLGLDETQTGAEDPLKIRVSIEARELDHIIEQLRQIRSKMNFQEIINAPDVKVTSQEVIKFAEHVKILGEIKQKARSTDKFINYMMLFVKNAASRGFYTGWTYFTCLTMYEDIPARHKDHNGRFNKISYYTSLLETVYMYIAIKELQKHGYEIRVYRPGHDFFIITNSTVSDELIITSSLLEEFKRAKSVDSLLDDYTKNAEKLYEDFPELFSHELKQELGL